jgi:hypothetical protein
MLSRAAARISRRPFHPFIRPTSSLCISFSRALTNNASSAKSDNLNTSTTATPADNNDEGYHTLIVQGDLAEQSPVRGCMILKPNGYALWERIREFLDVRFKETNHSNAYFPLLIPLSMMAKEAEHVEGFAKECAVVTHHRLRMIEVNCTLSHIHFDHFICSTLSLTSTGSCDENAITFTRP